MKELLLLIRVQARVATFLAELAADHLVALAEGKARLAVVNDGDDSPPARPLAAPEPIAVPKPRVTRRPAARPTRAAPPSSSFDAEDVAAQLRSCATVDQGTELLAKLNPGATDLKTLARHLGIPVSGTKAELSKRILTLTLASRSKHAALLQG